MSVEIKEEIQLEIAHVLFIDIVGYSKLSIDDQHAAIEELTKIVRASEQFQRAEAAIRLIRIPTGDGMVLVFYTNPEAPAQCAVEISRVLKEHPRLQVRMGIHSGPVSGIGDVNEQANLAGAGINMAKREMDRGDAGHVLLSRSGAEKTIAVVPFENVRQERQNECVADGVQDEMLTDLANIADLKVISRSSVMQSKSPAAAGRNLREIGQQLGVAHLLEGSVQRA